METAVRLAIAVTRAISEWYWSGNEQTLATADECKTSVVSDNGGDFRRSCTGACGFRCSSALLEFV